MINGRITTGSLGHHRGGVLTLAWQPGGALLASGGRDGELRLWRVGAAADRSHDDAGWDPVLSVAWSADGRRLRRRNPRRRGQALVARRRATGHVQSPGR